MFFFNWQDHGSTRYSKIYIKFFTYVSYNQSKKNNKPFEFNIFNTVRQLREMRLHCIQNSTQFYFIYLFVKYFLEHDTVNKFNIDFL